MQQPTLDCGRMSQRAFTRLRGGTRAAICVLLIAGSGTVGADDAQRVTLRMEPRQILEEVARQMNVALDPREPLPVVHFESQIPLAKFQDAVAGQWNFRPPKVANVYVVANNEIYLSDDGGYYNRMKRTLDESLAHEFAHYLQVRYFHANLSDETCETEAIAVQFAFREQQMLKTAAATQGTRASAS